jgi:hypothetical protein
MPRLQIDYSNTIVYKIVCKDLDKTECYVGHTTNFINRKHGHKKNVKDIKYCNSALYKFIRNNGGWENFDMVEVEKYNCKDVNEAHKYERHWIEQLQAKLNTYSPPETFVRLTKEERDADFELKQTMRAERDIKRKQQREEYDRRCKVQRMKQQQKKQNELEELERQFNAI